MEAVVVRDRASWNRALLSLPQPHVLQSWEWGAFKSRHGWSATRWLLKDAGGAIRAAALVLRRRLPRVPLSLLYVPKGPILHQDDLQAWGAILKHLEQTARNKRAMFVKIDPDVGAERTALSEQLSARKWRPSAEQIQFRNTMTLDLSQAEDALLGAMKSKWRYNIRLASRKGVTTRPGTIGDLPLLYDMYHETALRDDFVIRPFEYYRDVWGNMLEAGVAYPLVAQVDGAAVAMAVLLRFGNTAWYMYGASRNRHREKMPNHLLQWHAIRWARSAGCTVYDLWGAPDALDESDPMWGVYRFKRGFGADLVQHIGAYDYPASRLWYWAYTVAMPRLLSLMRRRYWSQLR